MKKFISVLTVALVFTTSTAFAKEYPQKFWDVPKDYWAFEYIADLADRNVINGYEDGAFKPEKTVSRSEWAKIMVDAAGVQVSDNALYFTDMSGHWANKYVNAAKNYLTGYADGSYRPDQAAVREDVTVAMVRLKGYDLSEVDYSYLNNFRDVDSISNYAKGYVAVAVKNNLISGFEDNTFRGQATLTRAEAATLLYRAFQHGNADKTTSVPTSPITNPQPSGGSANSSSANEYIKQAQPNYEQNNSGNNLNNAQNNTSVSNGNNQTEQTGGEITEETNKAAYRIETLKKANAKKGHSYITTDYKSKIYYVSDNAIYSLDINTKETNKLFDCSELDETEMFNTKNFEIVSICYNQNDGLIYLVGDYNGINSKTSTVATVSPSGNFNLITSEAGYLQSGITAFLSDGVFLSSEYVITAPEFKVDSSRSIGTPTYNNMAVVNNDGTVSSFNILPGNACVEYKYNFSELETPSKCTAKNAGISPYGKVFAIEKQLIIQPNSGAEKQITEKDYEVKDSLPINFSSGAAEFGLMLMQDESVVFYDISAKAFRIVRAN